MGVSATVDSIHEVLSYYEDSVITKMTEPKDIFTGLFFPPTPSLHLISNKRRLLRLYFLRPGRRMAARTGDRRPLRSGFSFLSCRRSACPALVRYARRPWLGFEVGDLLRCRGASFPAVNQLSMGLRRGGREAGGSCSRLFGVCVRSIFSSDLVTHSRSTRRGTVGLLLDLWWFAASGLEGSLARMGGSRRFADSDCFSP
ncbi:unnamed protein product [Brassica oleracea var. botrytis]